MRKKRAHNKRPSYPKHLIPLLPFFSNLQGEVIASGKDHLEIHCRAFPASAFAWFGDDEPPRVGCGNHRHDSLRLEIVPNQSRWIIRIFWNVESGGTRQIFWEAALAGRWFHALLDWLFR